MFDELTDSDFSRRSPYDRSNVATGPGDMETLQRFTQEEMEQKEKQAGFTRGMLKLVGVLDILVGVFCFAVAVFFVAAPDVNEKLSGLLPLTRLNAGLGMTIYLLLSGLLIAGGAGLLLKAPWGWIATAAACMFLIVERAGAIGLVFKEGYSQSGFFLALGPLLAALFLALFVYKGDTQEACGISTKVPLIIALLSGLALGGGAVAALFAAMPAAGM